MGPRPSGSGTRRKRPWPETSMSSGRAHSTQRRRRRLVGGKGTEGKCGPAPQGREVFYFLSPPELLAAGAGEVAAGVEVLLVEADLLSPPLELVLLLVDEDEEELPLSFLELP